MPKIRCSQLPDPDSFEMLPPGQYLCFLGEIITTRKEKDENGNDVEVPRHSKDGSEQWGLKWTICHGKYRGRHFFDNMTFSEKCEKRNMLVLKRVGLDVSKDLELTPEMILGKSIKATIEHAKGTDGKVREQVPFAGYVATSVEEAQLVKEGMKEIAAGAEASAAAAGVDDDGSPLPF